MWSGQDSGFRYNGDRDAFLKRLHSNRELEANSQIQGWNVMCIIIRHKSLRRSKEWRSFVREERAAEEVS